MDNQDTTKTKEALLAPTTYTLFCNTTEYEIAINENVSIYIGTKSYNCLTAPIEDWGLIIKAVGVLLSRSRSSEKIEI